MTLVNPVRATLAAIASLSLLILGQPALAQGYPPRIAEVIVDSHDALILIAGEGFNEDSPPVVMLDDDPLPLDLLSVTEYEIEVALPEVPDGDSILQVAFSDDCGLADQGCSALHIYSFDITIGAMECGDGLIDPGEECDDGIASACEEECLGEFAVSPAGFAGGRPAFDLPASSLRDMPVDVLAFYLAMEGTEALDESVRRKIECLKECASYQGGSSDPGGLLQNDRSAAARMQSEVLRKLLEAQESTISNIR
jgi:hypothetical protein